MIKFRDVRLYTCSICGNEFSWSKECYWYGTLENVLAIACSHKCQTRYLDSHDNENTHEDLQKLQN